MSSCKFRVFLCTPEVAEGCGLFVADLCGHSGLPHCMAAVRAGMRALYWI